MNTLFKYILCVSVLLLVTHSLKSADYKEITQKGVTYRLYSNYASVYTETTATELEIPEQVYYQATYYPVTEIELLWAKSSMNLTLPNSLKSFKKVLGEISSMPIPKGVENIAEECFDTLYTEYSTLYDKHCSCDAFVVDEDNQTYCSVDGILFSKDKKTLVKMPYKKDKDGFSYVIPSYVEKVAPRAFYYFDKMSQITFPSGMKEIGNEAFYNCTTIQTLQLPLGITKVGPYAFYNCKSLSNMQLPGTLQEIERYAFANCYAIKELTIPEGVVNIDSYAFYQDSNKAPIITVYYSAPSGKYYGMTSRYADYGIEKIVLPTSLKQIGDVAFGVSGSYYRDRKRIKTLTIPKNVSEIRNGAFVCCQYVGYQDYNGLYFFDNIYHYIDTIKTQIQKPFGVYKTALGLGSSDSGTQPVLIVPMGTRDLYSTTNGWKEFDEVEEENVDEKFQENGIHYISNFANRTATITGCDESVSGDLTLPTEIFNGTDLTVTGIADGVFQNNQQITSVQLPARLETIGKMVFANCSSITSFSIDANNPTFTTESGVLYDKRKTRLIAYPGAIEGAFMIPETVTTIEASAFEGASALSSITLRNTLSTIGKRAFVNCPSLRSIYSYILTPPNATELFDTNARYQITVNVVPAALSTYRNAEVWKDFDNIVPMDAVLSLKEKGLYIDANLETLSASIISADKQLEGDVVLPENVSYMGIRLPINNINASVFSSSSLLSVSLPSGITSLDKNVFAGCQALAAVQWNANTAMPNSVLSEVDNPNLLLYVKDASFAPSNVQNVIVNDVAEKITLSDSEHANFYAPKAFTANSISYTHNYSQISGDGVCQGWETIVLPFDVATISHDTRGEIIPFINWKGEGRPFWLRELTSNGFVDATSIRANKPYILCFPNNERYDKEYLLSGDITFSATGVQIDKTTTPTASLYKTNLLTPCYQMLPPSESIYALNVNNLLSQYKGDFREGSTFVRNLRAVRPFEAYITTTMASVRDYIPIMEDEEITSIQNLQSTIHNNVGAVYNLNGCKMVNGKLPKGVYIINGKKVIIK